MHELPGEEACLAGGREARGASGYGGQSRFSLTWLPHPAAYGVVKPLSLETSPVPQVVPLQAPSVVSEGEEVRPENGPQGLGRGAVLGRYLASMWQMPTDLQVEVAPAC